MCVSCSAIYFSFQNVNSWQLSKAKINDTMAETMEHHHDDVWKMKEEMISLFIKYLIQTASETVTNKHYVHPKSTAKSKMLFKHLLTQGTRLDG